jgi:hypothetical protein
MTNHPKDGGPAFPEYIVSFDGGGEISGGMSLRDWFAGQALCNPAICTGQASVWELREWFGEHRTSIARHEIVAKQAWQYADAMLAAQEGKE